MRHTHVCLTALILTTIATLALTTPPASADTYTVHSCTTPSGTWTGADGWTSSASSPLPGFDSGQATACATSPSTFTLQFGLTGLPVRARRWIRWTFAALPGTTIRSAVVWRAFQLGWPRTPESDGSPYALHIWHDDDDVANSVDVKWPIHVGDTLTMNEPLAVEAKDVAWDSLHIDLRCWAQMGHENDCAPYTAEVIIPRVTLGLQEDEAPTGVTTGGELVRDVPVRGVGKLSYIASDGGSGVYREIVSVDGVERAPRVIDASGGRCADVEPGNGDPYEFGSPQPCPADVDGEVELATTDLADGRHTLSVAIEDAAGNRTTIHDGTFTTHNAPVSTGAPVITGEAKVGAWLSASNGQWDGAPTRLTHRWLRCDPDGGACTPIPGAGDAGYTVTAADAAAQIVVEVTAENANGAGTARSAPSATVAGVGPDDTGAGDAGQQPGGGDAAGGGGGSSADRAGGATPPPAAHGIAGLANPLGDVAGHVSNGSGATAAAKVTVGFRRAGGRTATRVRSPRHRRWTIAGRLRDDQGRPIGGATLEVATQIAGRGWAVRGAVRTRPDGTFTYALSPGPSRAVRVVYFPFSDSAAPRMSNVVRQESLAPLTIRVDRRRVTGARVVTLSGRAGGELIPRAGLLVTLQGYQRGYGWRTFRTVRTNRHGAWRTRYRFRLSHGRFAFRAIVPHQGTYPFATSRSRAVRVTVA